MRNVCCFGLFLKVILFIFGLFLEVILFISETSIEDLIESSL